MKYFKFYLENSKEKGFCGDIQGEEVDIAEGIVKIMLTNPDFAGTILASCALFEEKLLT